MPKVSAKELEWQAESDADTMARYQEIMSDNKRRDRAMKTASKRADDLMKRADAFRKAGKRK